MDLPQNTDKALKNYISSVPTRLAANYNTSEQEAPQVPSDYKENYDRASKYYNASSGGRLGDYVRTFGAAIPQLGAGVAEIGEKVGLISEDTRNSIQKNAKETSDKLYAKTSKSFQEAASQKMFEDDPTGEKAWYQRFNPDYSSTTLAHDLTASAPGIIAMGGLGGVTGKVATSVLSPILTRLGIGGVAAEYFPSLAKLAETAFPGEASAASKVNKLIATQVGIRGGQVASEGLISAAQNASDKRQEALSTPIETFRKNPLFNEEVSKLDPSLSLQEREEQARKNLAEMAADHVFTETFKSTAGIAALTGGGALGDVAASSGRITNALHKTLLKEGFKEGIAQELPQSYNEQLIGNIATKKFIDPDKDVLEGTVDAALKGAVTGAVMGGGLGGVNHVLSPKDQQKTIDDRASVNPTNEVPWVNKDVQKNYTAYNQIVANNPDPNSKEYQDTYSSIVNSIKESVTPKGETGTVDPVKAKEAEDALKAINAGHESLLDSFNKERDAQVAAADTIKKADDEEVKATSDKIEANKEALKQEVISAQKEADKPIDQVVAEEHGLADSSSVEEPKRQIKTETDAKTEAWRLFDERKAIAQSKGEEWSDERDVSVWNNIFDTVKKENNISSPEPASKKLEEEFPKVSESSVASIKEMLSKADQATKDIQPPTAPTAPIETVAPVVQEAPKSISPAIDQANANISEKKAAAIAKREAIQAEKTRKAAEKKAADEAKEKAKVERQAKIDSIQEGSVINLKGDVAFTPKKSSPTATTGLSAKLFNKDTGINAIVIKKDKSRLKVRVPYKNANGTVDWEESFVPFDSVDHNKSTEASIPQDVLDTLNPTEPKSSMDSFKEALSAAAKSVEQEKPKETPIPPKTTAVKVTKPKVTTPKAPKSKSTKVQSTFSKEEIDSTRKEIEAELEDKLGKLEKIVAKKKAGEEVDWSKEWDEGSPVAQMRSGRMMAASHEVIVLQDALKKLDTLIPAETKAPIETKAPEVPVEVKAPVAPVETKQSNLPEGLQDLLDELEQAKAAGDKETIKDIRADIAESYGKEYLPNTEVVKKKKTKTSEYMDVEDEDTLDISSKGSVEEGYLSNNFYDESGNYDFNIDTPEEAAIKAKRINALARKVTSNVFKKFMGNISDKIKNEISIKYIDNFITHNWEEEGFSKGAAGYAGFASGIVRRKNGEITIYMNGSNTPWGFAGTLIHELVGHYGVRRFFELNLKKDSNSPFNSYDNFLNTLLKSNKELRDSILSKYDTWRIYKDNFYKQRGTTEAEYLKDKKKGEDYITIVDRKGAPVNIPAELALQYADEYIAELAKSYYFDKSFIEYEVGMGISSGDIRSSIRASRKALLATVLNKIKGFFKAIFGEYFGEDRSITNKELAKVIAQSYDSVFSKVEPSMFYFDKAKDIEERVIASSGYPLEVGEDIKFGLAADLATEHQIQNDPTQLPEEFSGPLIDESISENAKEFTRGFNSSYGTANKLAKGQLRLQIREAINSSPLLSSFKALGNMQFQEAYNALANLYKGSIGGIEHKTLAMIEAIGNLDPIRNELAFRYFTTKKASLNPELFSPKQIAIMAKLKLEIRDLGQKQVDLGLITQDTFDKFEDAYLHRQYLEYIKEYKGSNKRTSYLSHAKHRKQKSKLERIALGEIRDIKFLLADTLGTIGRDTILLQMFGSIKEASLDGGLHWVLASDEKVKWFRKKLTIDQALDQIAKNDTLISWYSKDIKEGTPPDEIISNAFYASPDKLQELIARNDKLKADVEGLTTKSMEEAFKAASSVGSTKATNQEDFLKDHYIRMPKDARFGALKNQYVRKEIYNDLDAFAAPYSLTDKSTVERILAPGGTLDRLNRYWKLSMVGLNPGSWARNAIGNFVLLDLSTPTNKFKLMGMLFDEVTSAINGKPSKFWQMAHEFGLFGTTFSAAEMQAYHNNYGDKLEEALAKHKATRKSAIDKSLFFTDERLMSLIEIGKSHAIDLRDQTQATTSKWFSLLEGAFKTVALRDYVELWEAQNNSSIDTLDQTQRRVVLSKAAGHANEHLFDYSQVNQSVKYLRRIPFGAPFLTYSYKAFPVAFRAAISNPVKFLEYATLPILLTKIAMLANNWDDDDVDKMKRSLADHLRLNPMIAFFPFKDEKGKPQVLDLSYLMPWSQSASAARKIYENYVEDQGISPVATTFKSIGTAANEFGLMGGPTPTIVSAMMTGKDSFTGRDIAKPGTSADQQMLSYMQFGWDLAVPAWLSSHGWMKKLYQSFGTGEVEKDRFGDVKFTPGQAVADIVGFSTKSVNTQHGLQNRRYGFEMELKDIASYRSKVLQDKNLNHIEKQNKLKDIVFREKLLRKRMQSETR